MAIKTIETIRRIRDNNYVKTKNMSVEERRKYYADKAKTATEKARLLIKQN